MDKRKIKTKPNGFIFEESTSSFKKTVKDNKKDRIEVELGDTKDSTKFFPQVKLMRWDNEVNFSARLKDEEVEEEEVTSDKSKVSWKKGNIISDLYELPESEDLPEGGYEFDITLKKKPKTNKIVFTIQTKGLDFFYQPELTQEEKDKGSFRPDNVIGSYAVYYKDCPINYVNGKEYKTGKAFHIYRPKIEDSQGSWKWGDLNINAEKGLMTVTIPQEFLDNAVYPVRHASGATFGYTTAGGSALNYQQSFGNEITSPSDIASASAVYIYENKISGPPNDEQRFAIYTRSGTTATIVSNSYVNYTITNASAEWHNTGFGTSPTLSASTAYLLMASCGVTYGYINLYYDSGQSEYHSNSGTYAGETTLTVNTTNSYRFSIYLTYTPTGTNANSSRGVYLIGKSTENSNRNIYITGKSSGNSERTLYLTGTLGANSERGIYLHGKDISSSERSLYLIGKSNLASSFIDNFDDNIVDGLLYHNNGGANIVESGQTLNITTNVTSGFFNISSVEFYDLTGNQVYIQVANSGNQSLTDYIANPIYLYLDDNNALYFSITNDIVYCYKKVGGVDTSLFNVAYNSTTHKWLRIRESAGTTYWDCSANGVSWDNLTSASNPISVTDLRIVMLAGTIGNTGVETTLILDNLNIASYNTDSSYRTIYLSGELPQGSSTRGIYIEGDDNTIDFKITNNLIVDSDRETWITELSSLWGLNYYPFKTDTIGLGYFEIGDRIICKDTNDVPYECVVMDYEINITQGIQETLKADIPQGSSTNYDYAGIIGQNIRRTEIITDKQAGVISLLSSQVSGVSASNSALTIEAGVIRAMVEESSDDIDLLQTNVTDLQTTAEAINLSISQTGGTNLLKNAVGLKGDIKEWQIYDDNGDLVDARNTGTIDTSVDTRTYTESKSAIVLTNQFVTRTVETIVGTSYTMFFRYKSTANTDLTITGVIGTINLPTSASWTTFKYQFVATSINTTVKIESGSSETITLSDIVLKAGDAGGWIQAPNEVYGTDFRFDKDGFVINKTDSQFKSQMTNEYFAVYDKSSGSDKVIMYVSKDSGKITNLYVQDLLQLQRYDNTAKAMRMIPTATGAMIVINN